MSHSLFQKIKKKVKEDLSNELHENYVVNEVGRLLTKALDFFYFFFSSLSLDSFVSV